jgi:hypothetical protein
VIFATVSTVVMLQSTVTGRVDEVITILNKPIVVHSTLPHPYIIPQSGMESQVFSLVYLRANNPTTAPITTIIPPAIAMSKPIFINKMYAPQK